MWNQKAQSREKLLWKSRVRAPPYRSTFWLVTQQASYLLFNTQILNQQSAGQRVFRLQSISALSRERHLLDLESCRKQSSTKSERRDQNANCANSTSCHIGRSKRLGQRRGRGSPGLQREAHLEANMLRAEHWGPVWIWKRQPEDLATIFWYSNFQVSQGAVAEAYLGIIYQKMQGGIICVFAFFWH